MSIITEQLLYKNGVEAKFKLFEIACQMNNEGFSKHLIVEIIINALKYEGLANAVELWSKKKDHIEKNEILNTIQDLIDHILKVKLAKEYIDE